MLGLPIYLLGSSYYLHTRIAGKQVKKSLRTSYKRVAIIRAVAFLNSLTMSQKPTIGDFAHLLTDNQTKSYEIDLSRGILKAEDSEDHQRLMQALQAMQNGSQPVKTATSEAIPPADDPTALKLGELLEKFFLLRKQLTQATAISYRNCITELAKFLKNPAITRITSSDITRYQEFLAGKNNSVRTIDNKISIIRSLYNFAKKQGYTREDNPAENRALLTKKQRLKGGYALFEKEEIRAIFNSQFYKEQILKDKDYSVAVIIGLFTGCRIGEITSLKKEQFKISENGTNYIVIRDSKTLAGIREVPLHPAIFNRIKRFVDSKTDKIFKYVEKDGKGTGNAVGKKFARNIESARITRDKLVFHSLRKFVNNELMHNGVSLENRCQFIGHEIDNVNISVYTKKLNIDELADIVFPTFDNIFKLIGTAPLQTDF
ncbi:site-specific integrase [Comamonas aquatica]|uniref:phage integrase n=1 Tax=Comamonas aquatica TaxID=225991 RepID=UPI002447B97F|nr:MULTISPECIES: phage integrase SAM-like domain-containing protein [Comamonas]MDH0373362.1 site-specific integrase [Comamonas aquatica]